MEYFLLNPKTKSTEGPYSLEMLRELVRTGRLLPDSLLSPPGGSDWKQACEVDDLFTPAPIPEFIKNEPIIKDREFESGEFTCSNFENAVRKNLGIYKSKLKFWEKEQPLDSEQLLKLKEFHLDSKKKIRSVSGIEKAKNLTSFSMSFYLGSVRPNHVSDAQIGSFEPIKQLKNLEALQLAQHENVDLECLQDLPLSYLSLPKCFLSDIRPLAKIQSLNILSLHGNELIDISPIAELKNLQILNLSFNKIHDVSPLKELKNLKIVHLLDNPVENWNSIARLNEPGRNVKIIRKSTLDMLTQLYLVRNFSMRLDRNVSDGEFFELTGGNVQYYRHHLSKDEKASFDLLDGFHQRLKATYSMCSIDFSS